MRLILSIVLNTMLMSVRMSGCHHAAGAPVAPLTIDRTATHKFCGWRLVLSSTSTENAHKLRPGLPLCLH